MNIHFDFDGEQHHPRSRTFARCYKDFNFTRCVWMNRKFLEQYLFKWWFISLSLSQFLPPPRSLFYLPTSLDPVVVVSFFFSLESHAMLLDSYIYEKINSSKKREKKILVQHWKKVQEKELKMCERVSNEIKIFQSTQDKTTWLMVLISTHIIFTYSTAIWCYILYYAVTNEFIACLYEKAAKLIFRTIFTRPWFRNTSDLGSFIIFKCFTMRKRKNILLMRSKSFQNLTKTKYLG